MPEEVFWEERGIYYRFTRRFSERPVLVFIHGLLGSSSAWRRFEEEFGDRYDFVSIDLPGYGKSRKPLAYDAYDIEALAREVDAVLSRIGVEAYIPVASSSGTLVALALTRMRPRGVRAAVFLSPVYGIRSNPLTRASRSVVRTASRLMKYIRHTSDPGEHVDYRKYETTGDWSVRRLAVDVPETTLRVYLAVLDQVYATDRDHWWRELSVPSLIVHGDKDTISPVRTAYALNSTLENSRLVIIPGGNHVIPLNRFEDVRQAMETFFADLG